MAVDFTNTVLDTFIAKFPASFNEGVDPSSPFYLKSVVKHPLQDDPTRRAFYLSVSPDLKMQESDTHWRMPIHSIRRGRLGIGVQLPVAEMGGWDFKMITFFLIEGWLPRHNSRDGAYINAGIMLRKLEITVARLMRGIFDDEGLATDDGLETSLAGYPNVFGSDGAHFELIGGEKEWYPKLSMRFHIFSVIHRDLYAPTALEDQLVDPDTDSDDDNEPEP